MFKSIFDVEIETGDGNRELEKVTVKPNSDRKDVLSVFLEKRGSEPVKYYDLSIQEEYGGPIKLFIEGDQRYHFIQLAGNEVKNSFDMVDEINGELIEIGLMVYLYFFTKLKIEVTIGNILFTFT